MDYAEYLKESLSGRKICACPMGVGGRALCDQFEKFGINIDFFADKRPGVQRNSMHQL